MSTAAGSQKLSRSDALGLGLGLFLVVLAGFVDAVGFLALSGLFVSFMSGNSTQFAAVLASGEIASALSALWLILAFVAGVAAGTAVVERAPSPAAAVILYSVECAAIFAAAIAAADAVSVPRLLPLAFAMGLQNNLRQKVAGTQIGSTFVTGALVSTGQGLARHLLGRAGAEAWAPHAASWTALVVGAVVGGWTYLAAGLPVALIGPAVVTALLAGLHLWLAVRGSRAAQG